MANIAGTLLAQRPRLSLRSFLKRYHDFIRRNRLILRIARVIWLLLALGALKAHGWQVNGPRSYSSLPSLA